MEVEEAEEERREEGGRGGGGEESEGKRLAEVVKETHRLLRANYKEAGGGAGAGAGVWREHLGKEEHLHRYAQAMHTLATQHWPSENQVSISRVGWVRAAVKEYYWGGGLVAATDKEMRKLSHFGLAPDHPYSLHPPPPDSTVRVLDVGSCYNPFSAFPELEVTAIDLCPAHESVLKGDFLNLEIVEKEDGGGGGEGTKMEEEEERGEKGKGSTKVEEEEGREEDRGGGGGGSTEVEKKEEERKTHKLMTTEEEKGGGRDGEEEEENNKEEGEGERGDEKQREESRETGDRGGGRGETEGGRKEQEEKKQGGGGGERQEGLKISPTTTTTITTLTASSFDVVVLSLVLEYLPAPAQRFECCSRAWQLLTPGGLLAIITPDSRHQGANAHLYQLWRVSLAGLGFGRIKYDKQPHFHGFLFRKGLCRAAWQGDVLRFLNSALSAASSVRAKLRGIDYSKVDREMYIPQDFEDEGSGKGGGRKRRRKACDQADGCKKLRKEYVDEGGRKEEMDEAEREKKGGRNMHEGEKDERSESKEEERQGMEETGGKEEDKEEGGSRTGEVNGKREKEEEVEEVMEENGERREGGDEGKERKGRER